MYAGTRQRSAAGVVASPVSADRVKEHAVDRYSDGLAPLFVPVALWVGGMVTYMVLRAVSQRALASTASSYRAAVAGLVPGALLGIVQAVVLVLVLLLGVGIESPDPVATVAFAALVAVVFTAVHQCLNALLGGVGRLVALVLLVLQLTSRGRHVPGGDVTGVLRGHPPLPADELRRRRAAPPRRRGRDRPGAGRTRACSPRSAPWRWRVTVLACHRRRTWTIAELHPSLSL